MAKPILLSTGVGTAVAVLMLCIGSLVLSAADLASSLIPTLSLLSLLIASFGAGWLAARLVGEKGMLAGALTG
ncbi:MAG: TIGR04086 family membrane protein, partial [Clostridia bacterium]|nr:TIGR04086 family membrane protein [Clostridia bacterium]